MSRSDIIHLGTHIVFDLVTIATKGLHRIITMCRSDIIHIGTHILFHLVTIATKDLQQNHNDAMCRSDFIHIGTHIVFHLVTNSYMVMMSVNCIVGDKRHFY
uniref:Uncharacterized protein n=1 Tax=Cacopsylla melanoneura TaxID=428564 RepID=A0A8D9AV91_9HEMI